MYYNTNNESGETLVQSEKKSNKQESLVLDYLKTHGECSSEQVHEAIFDIHTPLTSTRRALTNLYNEGKVLKCGQVKGKYGKMIYTWRFNNGLLF